MEQHGTHWKAELEALFRPASIAVVGASESGRGARIIDNLRLVGYPGKIYAVNPRHASIKALRCYPSILAIEEDIDAVTIQVPAASVPGMMNECAEKKVKAVVINSAGFAETQNAEGIGRQRQVVEAAERGKIPVCGPNCQGLFSISQSISALFCRSEISCEEPDGGSGCRGLSKRIDADVRCFAQAHCTASISAILFPAAMKPCWTYPITWNIS